MLKLKKNKYLFAFAHINILMAFMASSSQGQGSIGLDYATHSDSTYIRWVSQFPSPEDTFKKHGFLKRVGEFLVGKKNPTIRKPISVLAKNPDLFWILDQGNGMVVGVNENVGEVPKHFNKTTKRFFSLVGICSRSNNDILFTDSRSNDIYSISNRHKRIQILNDSLNLTNPTGIAYSETTNEIWVIETSAHRISVIDENGQLIKKIGKRGDKLGEFNFPTHIWIDKSGTVFVVDAMNFRVQIIDKSGTFISFFGEAGNATGYFARPKGIATDSFGNIYVVDTLFHTVQVFNKSGNLLYYFGGQGRDNGQFWMPSGIYIDNNDFIYVADSYNSRVQIFKIVKDN